MRQLFSPGADAVLRLVVFSAIGCLLLFLVLVGGLPNSTWATGVWVAPAQPVPFSHKHHYSQLGIDCRYCHTTVTTEATAGLPPTHTCMTCHSQIWNHAPMLAPVRDSLANDRPLDWARVNRLPDYVYFNHAIHVTKGIGCSTCHGKVQDMQLTWRAQPFTMSFCISCHESPASYLRKPEEVWDMNWQPQANQDTLGVDLMKLYHTPSSARLTDCSTCHR